ncbi:tagatose 1,6-diphosphate aldolase [Candidatus Poribacteria bacterium]|nr:tagatose 1,6-diphosphate aldolase [Candidatus Poribacteria bacterium]
MAFEDHDVPRLTPGKRRGLERIAGSDGRFRMLATDQRGSLIRSLASQMGCREEDVTDEALRAVKRSIIKHLTRHATGLLTDPTFGFASAMDAVGNAVGLLLCIDESGVLKLGGNAPAKVSARLETFSIEQAKRCGADAVKVLVPYRPDAQDGSSDFQERYVRSIGAECARWDIAFVLEIVAYEMGEPGKSSPEYASAKPRWVADSARVFSRPEFRADVLKLEFPAELRMCEGFADGRFGGAPREPVYSLSEVESFCRDVDSACDLPWVILSAGVGFAEFVENVKLACRAGASGFLCGRALWSESAACYPDLDAMDKAAATVGMSHFVELNQAAANALPWFEHRSIGGKDRLRFPETWFA